MTKNQSTTNHYLNQRYKREKFINECIGGDGNIIDKFVVDKGHSNGMELHCVTDNGIILIYNLQSEKLITKIVARPQQIKRLYRNAGKENKIPSWLMELAEWHKELGYNK